MEGYARICLSNPIWLEYIDVLGRPKFSRFPDFKRNADFLITRLGEIADIKEPTVEVNLIKDESDNRFLELADVSKADFIVTGNTTDFTMHTYGTTQIVTPKEYWEDFK